MNSVKINKKELLSIVRENLDKHVKEYNESVEDFKALAIKVASANLKLAKSGDLATIAKMESAPRAPQSYEQNYHRAIRMLELSVDEVIELEEDVFNQLVLDEWTWKHSFVATSAMYKAAL